MKSRFKTIKTFTMRRSTVVILMLVGLILGGFVVTQAAPPLQESLPNNQNQIILIPGTVEVESELEVPIRQALSDAYELLPPSDYYAVTDVQVEGDWRFVSVAGLIGVKDDLNWNLLDHLAWPGLVLLHQDRDDQWRGATEGTEAFSQLLDEIPDEIVSARAKIDLDPRKRPQMPVGGYIFPWQRGQSMYYGSKGVHENGFDGVVPNWKAVDFLSDGNTGAGHAPNSLLASAAGTIGYKCSPLPGETSTAIRIGDLMYTHLLDSSDLYVNRSFSQGEEMGSMETGDFNERCGYADQGTQWFHVHLGFPNSTSITFEQWTLNLSTELWTRGTETKGPGSWIEAEAGSSCCGCLLAQPLVDAQPESEYEAWLAAQVGVEGVRRGSPLGLEGLLLGGEDVVMGDGVGGMGKVVDGEAPVLEGVEEVVWANEAVVPRFRWAAAEDEGGVTGYYVYWGADEAGVGEVMVREAAYSPVEEVAGDEAAVRYLRVAAEDEAGNVSEWQTVGVWHYDPVAPTGRLMVGSGGERVRSLNVTLNVVAEDAEGAVTGMRFGVDGEKWTAWEPYQARRWWRLENHGERQVLYAQVRDEAGNVSQAMMAAVVAELNVEPPSSDSYTLARSAVTMGGGEKTSPSYLVRGNSGQSHQTGELTGSSYRVISGFWAGIDASTSASTDEIMLRLSPVTVSSGISQTFEVEMMVQAGTAEVDGASAYLNFNPAELRVLSITPGSDFPIVLQNDFDNNTGEVDFAAGALSEPYPSGTFTLATVTFEAIEESNGSAIDFNMTAPRQSDITFGGTSLLESTAGSTVMISSLTTLRGCVTLQGRDDVPPPHARWSVPLRVSLTDTSLPVLGGGRNSEPTYNFEVITDEEGCFEVTGIAPGTYEGRIKKSTTLQNTESVILIAGMNDIDFDSLLREGDANDDNYVTILDFSILAGAFGTCEGDQNFDPRADFNGDGCITILDFSLLASNFGQSGDTLAPSEQSHQPTQAVTMLIEPTSTSVKPGDLFSVRVQLQTGNQKLDGAQILLDFDPQLLQVEHLMAGEAFPLALANHVDNRNGTLTFAAGTLEAFPSGTFDVLTLQLRALAATDGTQLTFAERSLEGSDVTFGGKSVQGGYLDGVVIVHEPTSIMLEQLAAPATAMPVWVVLSVGLLVLGGIWMRRRKRHG